MIATVAVLGCWSCLVAHRIVAQSRPALPEFVQKLRSDKTTDEARKQLVQLANSDPDVKHYLAAQLPPMIEIGPKSCPPSDIQDVFERWCGDRNGSLRSARTRHQEFSWILLGASNGLKELA